MRLFATLVPPPGVVYEVRQAVASVSVGRSRPGKRRADAKPESSTGLRLEHQLDLMPEFLVQTPVTVFGNLTTPDAHRLVELLAQEAATWAAPRLRLAGGEALVWPGDTWVWSRIDGDTPALDAIAGGVARVAERLSMYVDRRRFHPLLPLGQVNDETDGEYLEALVAALERHVGTTWVQQELTLAQGAPPDSSRQAPLATYAQLRLGG
ncbi:MAG: 2,3-cyclic phosphodiesterase [Nocardioidaceae bacterium]|nr:2,3-cyclic phosphodiesterase [Nocardioidaceae bacterium]